MHTRFLQVEKNRRYQATTFSPVGKNNRQASNEESCMEQKGYVEVPWRNKKGARREEKYTRTRNSWNGRGEKEEPDVKRERVRLENDVEWREELQHSCANPRKRRRRKGRGEVKSFRLKEEQCGTKFSKSRLAVKRMGGGWGINYAFQVGFCGIEHRTSHCTSSGWRGVKISFLSPMGCGGVWVCGCVGVWVLIETFGRNVLHWSCSWTWSRREYKRELQKKNKIRRRGKRWRKRAKKDGGSRECWEKM